MNAKEIGTQKRKVHQGRPADQLTKALALVPMLLQDVERLLKQVAATMASFTKLSETWTGRESEPDAVPHVDTPTQDSARYAREGAFVAATLEAAYSAYVAPVVLNFRSDVAVVVGLLIGLFMAVLTATILNTRFRDGEPMTSFETLKKFTGGVVTTSTLALAALLAMRFYPVPRAIEIVLAILGFSLPAAAGSLFYLSRKTDQLNRLAREWISLDDELRLTRAFAEELQQMIASHTPPPATPATATLTVAAEPKKQTTSVVATLVALVMSTAVVGSAHAQKRPVINELHYGLDASGSLHGPEYARVLKVFATTAAVPLKSVWRDVRVVEILPWSGALDVWSGATHRYDLPPPANLETFVDTEPPALFKAAATASTSEARRAVDARNAEALRSRERQMSLVLRQIGEQLLALDPAKQAPQSCVHDIVLRALHESRDTVTIIISDAEPWACGHRVPKSANSEETNGQVYFILVPGRNDGNAARQKMETRAERLHRDFPAVHIIPSYKVDERWQWIR